MHGCEQELEPAQRTPGFGFASVLALRASILDSCSLRSTPWLKAFELETEPACTCLADSCNCTAPFKAKWLLKGTVNPQLSMKKRALPRASQSELASILLRIAAQPTTKRPPR